ncbi:MAG: hypothetical protein HOP04_08150 [Methylophilaceae bacterium]|nr:hypothetical protein [Methylophilaceae bacterium]
MNWKTLLFISLIAYGAYQHWQKRPVIHVPGLIAAEEPIQHLLENEPSINHDGYQITPLADFHIAARVLSAEHYLMDTESELAPVDLVMGWGVMSDQAVLDKISISQSHRFYFWHVESFPIPREEIETHSANMHMIPANNAVKKILESIRAGQVVTINGYLVEAKNAQGWHWRSSLTRNDTGNGACELLLVKSVVVR